MKPRWAFVIILAAVVVVNLRINKYQTEIDTSLIAVIDTLHAQIDSLKILTANTGAIVCDYAVLKIPEQSNIAAEPGGVKE